MNQIANTLRERFQLAFDASPFSSRRKLSEASGVSPSLVGKIMAGHASKDGPSVFPLWRIANQMGSSLDELLPPDRDQLDRPTTQDFLARSKPKQGLMSDFRDILDFCDIYRPPRVGRSRVFRIGPRSTLGEKTQLFDPTIHQIEYDSWSKDVQAKIFNWQKRAWDERIASQPDFYSASYKSTSRKISGPILKSACRLADDIFSDNLEERLLVFVEQIWK